MFLYNKIAFYVIKPFLLKKIATDDFGNTYYVHRLKRTSLGKARRLCLYKGIVESSKVPPVYHAWLHYATDDLPIHVIQSHAPARKGHLPNLTGTRFANTSRANTTAERTWYQKWKPN